MKFSDEANLTYIPLSSFIVLLIVLLTCASRKRKIKAFTAVEKSQEDDLKAEYAILCFPCLKKKPDENDVEPTTDLTDQFEYVVEKYTIRKIPLLLANTVEDVIERNEELEMSKAENSQMAPLEKDDFVNFQIAQDVCNEQTLMPCITGAASTTCPGKKLGKDRPKPSDILESMSPIPRPQVRNHNYVIIPTKGSLRQRDIMLTKREITTQYLNNFSSVFIDNLKDQVPKDPNEFPNLSRPYTSAYKNYPISPTVHEKSSGKKSKKDKAHRVAYAFPCDEINDNPNQAESYYESNCTTEPVTEPTESEFPREIYKISSECADTITLSDKDDRERNLFCMEQNFDLDNQSPLQNFSEKERSISPKIVTYEDIQALDVGYEFSSCEKLGVKPKMTRIHYHQETDKLVETIKQLALSETAKMGKKNFSQDFSLTTKVTRTTVPDKPSRFPAKPLSPSSRNSRPTSPKYGNFTPPLETQSKESVAETCSPSKTQPANNPEESIEPQTDSVVQDQASTLTFTSKSVYPCKSRSANDVRNVERSGLAESVSEISKLYDLEKPLTKLYESNGLLEPASKEFRLPAPSKSRSFQETGRFGSRKETASGNTPLPYNSDKQTKRMQESETETISSLYSHESKTSTMVTSVRSSEVEEGKRATLRWKIIIKHHRRNSSSNKVIKKFSS